MTKFGEAVGGYKKLKFWGDLLEVRFDVLISQRNRQTPQNSGELTTTPNKPAECDPYPSSTVHQTEPAPKIELSSANVFVEALTAGQVPTKGKRGKLLERIFLLHQENKMREAATKYTKGNTDVRRSYLKNIEKSF